MLKDLCFEIIKTCPNNCLFCSSCSQPDSNTIIDFELFKKTIDHLISLGGIEEISLSGGEPFLHPDLFKMISYCKKKNIRTVLFTSGIKRKDPISEEEKNAITKYLKNKYHKYEQQGLDKEKSAQLLNKELEIYTGSNQSFTSISSQEMKLLKELGLDKIVFDFQAGSEDSYNKIMGTKNYFSLLATSLTKAASNGLDIDIHFIPTHLNYKELPEIIDLLNIVNCKSLSILNFVPQGRGKINKDKLLMSDEEMQEFIEIYNQAEQQFNGKIRIGIPLIKNDNHLCTAGLSKLVIKYDGTVLPCPAFKEYPLEELNSKGIKTPNIHTDLNSVKIYSGSRKKPLCKQLYNFQRNIK